MDKTLKIRGSEQEFARYRAAAAAWADREGWNPERAVSAWVRWHLARAAERELARKGGRAR